MSWVGKRRQMHSIFLNPCPLSPACPFTLSLALSSTIAPVMKRKWWNGPLLTDPPTHDSKRQLMHGRFCGFTSIPSFSWCIPLGLESRSKKSRWSNHLGSQLELWSHLRLLKRHAFHSHQKDMINAVRAGTLIFSINELHCSHSSKYLLRILQVRVATGLIFEYAPSHSLDVLFLCQYFCFQTVHSSSTWNLSSWQGVITKDYLIAHYYCIFELQRHIKLSGLITVVCLDYATDYLVQ